MVEVFSVMESNTKAAETKSCQWLSQSMYDCGNKYCLANKTRDIFCSIILNWYSVWEICFYMSRKYWISLALYKNSNFFINARDCCIWCWSSYFLTFFDNEHWNSIDTNFAMWGRIISFQTSVWFEVPNSFLFRVFLVFHCINIYKMLFKSRFFMSGKISEKGRKEKEREREKKKKRWINTR